MAELNETGPRDDWLVVEALSVQGDSAFGRPLYEWERELLAPFGTTHTSKEEDHMIALDFETYCELDIRKVGLDNYLNHPSFKPLGASVFDGTHMREFDFINDPVALEEFGTAIRGGVIIAHNAGFEKGVIRRMGVDRWTDRYIDTAVLARCYGLSSSLDAAVKQILPGRFKMPEGKRLIQKFSLPQKDGTCLVDIMHAQGTLEHDADWELFSSYRSQDTKLAWDLNVVLSAWVMVEEQDRARLTADMNEVGWHVDMEAVREMQVRYEDNLRVALERFRNEHDELHELNFNSLPQLKKWCATRGVKATSFNEAHVAKLIRIVRGKLTAHIEGAVQLTVGQVTDYSAVLDMLETKQTLGGSSLKKLKVLEDTVSVDGRLRNQYMHAGAGQTYRTSGRGVQLQNLKRLSKPRDMGELYFGLEEWTNEELANNLRQVFTATDPKGALIVGDFSSVESRGLAYLAGARWKLDAFGQGWDLYKVQASHIFGVEYATVTKEQRQVGKVGELSCGYGAGSKAVKDFAEKMGVALSEAEASNLVKGWRDLNTEIVELWDSLDTMLHQVVESGQEQSTMLNGSLTLLIKVIATPHSLTTLHPGAHSIEVRLESRYLTAPMVRVFHGCYLRGRSICYYKPSTLVNGNSWVSYYVDPATKARKYFSIYGGKLAGIVTQSFCREIFFETMTEVANWVVKTDNVQLVGQFHDELVLDWTPPAKTSGLVESLESTKEALTRSMSTTRLPGFPLAAEIKHDYRYTK